MSKIKHKLITLKKQKIIFKGENGEIEVYIKYGILNISSNFEVNMLDSSKVNISTTMTMEARLNDFKECEK